MSNHTGELKIVIPPKILLTGKTNAKLTLNGEPVPNADVIWGAQGASWIDQGGDLHSLELGKTRLKAYAYGKVLTADITVVEKVAPVRRRRGAKPLKNNG